MLNMNKTVLFITYRRTCITHVGFEKSAKIGGLILLLYQLLGTKVTKQFGRVICKLYFTYILCVHCLPGCTKYIRMSMFVIPLDQEQSVGIIFIYFL